MNGGRQGQQRGGGERQEAHDRSWVAEVIVGGNYTKLDAQAQALVARLEDATRTQVRGIFGTIKRLESLQGEPLKRELALLRPRLAYSAARVRGLDDLRDVLTEASRRAEEDPGVRVQRLVDLMEAILCYSTAARSHKEKA
jgi:CRISPR type III-A-associated protein Csm2